MPGESNLRTLLQHMKPEMQDGIFVFCSLPEGNDIPAALAPVLIFREREGTALIVRREEAERAELPYQFASRLITLTVHSSLEAVGFLAAITARLANAGISVNAVSAFHHDHLFVPEHRASEALRLLQDMCTSVARMRTAISGTAQFSRISLRSSGLRLVNSEASAPQRLQALEGQPLGIADAGQIEFADEGGGGLAVAIGQCHNGIDGNSLGVHGLPRAVGGRKPRSVGRTPVNPALTVRTA